MFFSLFGFSQDNLNKTLIEYQNKFLSKIVVGSNSNNIIKTFGYPTEYNYNEKFEINDSTNIIIVLNDLPELIKNENTEMWSYVHPRISDEYVPVLYVIIDKKTKTIVYKKMFFLKD